MAVLKILTVPNKILKAKSEPVKKLTEELIKLADDMVETMFAKSGSGLAAPQVGVLKQIIVICASRVRGEEHILINPKILSKKGYSVHTEGCLSVPDTVKKVRRSNEIKISARTMEDTEVVIEASGWMARVIQHEIDHLNGILFTDRK